MHRHNSLTSNTLLPETLFSGTLTHPKHQGHLLLSTCFFFFLNFSGLLIFKFLSGSSLLATLRQGLAFSGSTKKWSH